VSTNEPERTRAALALGMFFGVLLAWVAAIPLLPALGSPLGFIVLGAIAGIPMFLMLVPRIGLMRALILTAATAVALGLGFFILAFGACVATNCIG
jgi:hypothetical protein